MIEEPAVHVNAFDYEEAARALIPPPALGYIAGGAEDEDTLRENRAAFQRRRLVPRVLRGVSQPDLRTTVLDQDVSMPILLAPIGLQQLLHPEGERAVARAARASGTIFTLSTVATTAVEDVAGETDRWWFQLYFLRDRGLCRDLVQRAESAGASALVLTVDLPVLGRREADMRNRFSLSTSVRFANFMRPEYLRAIQELPDVSLAFTADGLMEPALRWEDVDWLASVTTLPLVLKGILAPDDARLACEHGASAIVVSTHGGRQLDYAIASLDALPAVVDAVDGRIEVLLDSGVRRGTDVVKALALGARAVFLGRPYLWALAVGGADGVKHLLDLLRIELEFDFRLCGLATVADISRDLIAGAS